MTQEKTYCPGSLHSFKTELTWWLDRTSHQSSRNGSFHDLTLLQCSLLFSEPMDHWTLINESSFHLSIDGPHTTEPMGRAHQCLFGGEQQLFSQESSVSAGCTDFLISRNQFYTVGLVLIGQNIVYFFS